MLFVVPEKVTGLSKTAVLINSISLQWNRVGGTVNVNYIVTWTPTDTTGITTVMINENKTTINRLQSNSEYSFNVKARNQGGDGEISDAKSFVTSKQQNEFSVI